MRLLWILLVGIVVFSPGCDDPIYVERSSCLSCHRPIQRDGSAIGLEHAHPEVDGKVLACVDCHGGNPDARKQSEAHVLPGRNAATFLKNLTIGELDSVEPAYLQFVNPGDLRVAKASCGEGGGSNCHQSIIETVKTNQMATFSGELGVARFRAGEQNSGASQKAIYDVRDPDFIFGEIPGTVGVLDKMEEPRVSADETAIGPFQDIYLTKACMRCHLWSFGDNKFPGDFRSSGCTACHMTYGNNGLSESQDPTVNKAAPPHPIKHQMVKAAPTEQCMHCHYRGGRIGPSFMGFREGAGPGFDGPRVGYLGVALHGHDANFYIDDEDLDNDIDETPADLHFKAGMHCVDCHTEKDVHGDGHIYNDTNTAVEIRCEDCHGTINHESTLTTSQGNPLPNLQRDENGKVWLIGKVDGKAHEVTQVKKALEESAHDSFLRKAMGRNDNGFSHLDDLSCDTCHSGWTPNCYGCHVTVDMSSVQRSLISGNSTPGKVLGTRKWVTTDDLILMHNTDGKITPSMPSEKMFFTAINGAGETVIDNEVRTTVHGEIGHGQRAFHPHTTQRWSPFMRCDRCHLLDTGENRSDLDIVFGFGSDRFIDTDGDGHAWRMDRIQPEWGLPVVSIGHDDPLQSKPLDAETIAKMIAVIVSAPDCPVPEGAAAPLDILQETIFSPSCATSECHDSVTKAYGVDLTAGQSWSSLVNQPSFVRAGATLVIPGQIEQSYLMQKLLATGEYDGDPMPAEGEKLTECQLEMIRGWIAAGAKR